jgi:hypothetical protein
MQAIRVFLQSLNSGIMNAFGLFIEISKKGITIHETMFDIT